jgi:hypothetical protein
VRIWVLAMVLVTGCASRAPSQSLKTENKRLRNELADARRQQAEADEKLKALQLQLAQLDQATKAKEIELAKLRTESSASWKELAEARRRPDATDKRIPPQCPPGTVLDATGTTCVAAAPPPPPSVPPPVTPAPVIARILKVGLEGDFVLCVLGAGSDSGIAKTWRAQFLRGSTASPLVGGKAEIMRVDRRTTTIKVKMTTDAIAANPMVELSPPAP